MTIKQKILYYKHKNDIINSYGLSSFKRTFKYDVNTIKLLNHHNIINNYEYHIWYLDKLFIENYGGMFSSTSYKKIEHSYFNVVAWYVNKINYFDLEYDDKLLSKAQNKIIKHYLELLQSNFDVVAAYKKSKLYNSNISIISIVDFAIASGINEKHASNIFPNYIM